MHSAKIEQSPRLMRVFRVLSDRKQHTTRDIMRKANVCAVNSCVAELRDNGIAVECHRTGSLWRYWLAD